MTMTDQSTAVAAAAVQAMADAAAEEAAAGLVIPDEIRANARELDDIRTALKAIEKREKVLRASVLDYLVSIKSDAAASGGVAISLSKSARTGVDTKRLEALYPKVYANVKTSTPVVQVRVKVSG